MCLLQNNAAPSAGSSTEGDGNEPARNQPTSDQRRARLDEIDKAQRQLDDERAWLHLEIRGSKDPTSARVHAQDVHRRIVDDAHNVNDCTLVFKRAS